MYYLIEIVLVVYILYQSKKILTNPIYRNISNIIGILAAVTGSSLVLYISTKLMPRLFDNLLLRLIIAIALASLVFAGICATFPKKCHSFLEKKMKLRTHLTYPSRLLEKSANTIFLFCFLAWILVIFNVSAQLMSLSPFSSERMNPTLSPPGRGIEKTFLENRLSGKEISFPYPEWQKVVLNTREAQQKFLRSLSRGFRKTKDFLAEKTGINTIQEHIEIVKKLSQLSDEEKIWLIQTTPALQKLANNPSLLAVIEDERLLTLIMEASQGSFKALYRLGEEPLIQNLFDDEEFVESVKQIRLKELFQKVKYEEY